MFTRSARQFSYKVKAVLDTLVELSDSPEEVFVYNKPHSEQKERVAKFQRQISEITLVEILQKPQMKHRKFP